MSMGLTNRAVLSFILSLLLLCASQSHAHNHHPHDTATIQTIAEAAMPDEARYTFHIIKQGGPFSFPRDGIVFANREQMLPTQPRGYYHEYTVKTPGAYNRGARRIVCGIVPECYYSADHYQTFKRIKE
jgi:ribonuclease T1